jgi:predicted aspartyl protease
LLAACAHAPRLSLEIAPAPAPIERRHPGFWDAALAFDFERAQALATREAQRDYVAALRLVAEGRLEAAQDALSRLIAARDPEVLPRARALLVAVVKETLSIPDNAFTSRVDRSFAEALHEAKAQMRWTFPAERVQLGFERGISRTPRIPARVNGHPTELGLDSGAGITVIGSELAAAVGARLLGARTGARDAHGEGVLVELAVVDLELGGIRIEGLPVMVIDSARLRFRVSNLDITGFDGVVGWNALAPLRVVIDNSAQTVGLGPSRATTPRSGDLFWVGEPYVRAHMANGLPVTLFLDTGASRSSLASPLAGAAGLRPGTTRSSMVMAAGSSRRMDITVHPEAAIHVGGARIRLDELQSAAPRSTGYAIRDGVLGADALVEGRIVMDFRGGEFSVTH